MIDRSEPSSPGPGALAGGERDDAAPATPRRNIASLGIKLAAKDAQRSAERRSHSSFFCAAAAGAAAASWFARARASTAFTLRLSRSRPT